MVVQIEPTGAMDRNPDQQQYSGAGESGEEGSERGKGRCGHQGDPNAVEWTKHDHTVCRRAKRCQPERAVGSSSIWVPNQGQGGQND